MGPPFLRGGECTCTTSMVLSPTVSFNGAALFTGRRVQSQRTRHDNTERPTLQWGRPFYGAERLLADGLEMYAPEIMASMGPPFLPGGELRKARYEQVPVSDSFNGAALFTGRRAVLVGDSRHDQSGWLCGHCGFNGAALFTGRRGPSSSSCKTPTLTWCFNGAALFTGRRGAPGNAQHPEESHWLQWGRPFYRAERQCENARTQHQETAQQASMGPPFLPGGEAKI